MRGVLTTSAFTSRLSRRVSQRRLSVDSDSVTLDSDSVRFRPDLDSGSERFLPLLHSESVLFRSDPESFRFRPTLDSESVCLLGDSAPARFRPTPALSESRLARLVPVAAIPGCSEAGEGSRAPAQISTLAIHTRFFTH